MNVKAPSILGQASNTSCITLTVLLLNKYLLLNFSHNNMINLMTNYCVLLATLPQVALENFIASGYSKGM